MKAKPRKTDQYLANGGRLAEVVNAYRAARGAASAEEPLTQNPTPVGKCNKPKSYPLPTLETPTPIEGFPLNPTPAQEVPDFGTINRLKRLRRAGRTLPDPIGPPELVKRHDVRTWRVAE